MTILDEIAAYAFKRIEEAKKIISLEAIKIEAYKMEKADFPFEKALKKEGLAFICEVKKASPSKGIIDAHFDYLKIAHDYEVAGADCLSVLTEPKWFLGADAYLKEISETVSIPILRKDFVVDEYMIYEAKCLGASAVLLICSILSDEQIQSYIKICDDLGLSALVEAHDLREVERAIVAQARLIGVNNRNLKDFSIDTSNSAKLRLMIPSSILFVSESGVQSRKDIEAILDFKANAVLIGESLMKAEDKTLKLKELKGLI